MTSEVDNQDLKDQIESDFFGLIHKKAGICMHCGKVDCAGKSSMSTLPQSLPTSLVIEAFDKAVRK